MRMLCVDLQSAERTRTSAAEPALPPAAVDLATVSYDSVHWVCVSFASQRRAPVGGSSRKKTLSAMLPSPYRYVAF